MLNKKTLGFCLISLYLLFVWSSAYSAVKIGLKSFSPETMALFRFCVASSVLGIISVVKRIKLPDLKDIPVLLVCGLLGIALYHVGINTGQETVSAGSASIILNSYPIFVAILSGIMLKESVCLEKWLGIILSFAGIAYIAAGEGSGLNFSSGALILLGSAFSLSIFDVSQKKLLKKYSPIELTSYAVWAGTLLLSVFSHNMVQDFHTASLSSIISVIYLGIFPGAISYLVWSQALSKYSITNLSTLFYIIPIFTIAIAFLVLNEIPHFSAIIGGVVVLSGVAIVNFSSNIREFIQKFSNKTKCAYEIIKSRKF